MMRRDVSRSYRPQDGKVVCESIAAVVSAINATRTKLAVAIDVRRIFTYSTENVFPLRLCTYVLRPTLGKLSTKDTSKH